MNSDVTQYELKKKKCIAVFFVLFITILVTMLTTVGFGAMDIDYRDISSIIWGKITGNLAILENYPQNEIAVVWDIRLPRILCAFFVGLGLAVSGAVFQSLLRNPLADPYTLGVSGGAAFGASLAIYLGITYGMMFPVVNMAFIFSAMTLFFVIMIAQSGGGLYSTSLIISGIIVSSILSSGVSFLKMLAGENVSAIVFWLMGSLSGSSWQEVTVVGTIIPVSCLIIWCFANDLDVMTLGEDTALSLGINTKRTRLILLILGAAITASCVAISGIIGFVGLIVPHMLRFWLTSSNRSLIPLSALLGGFILLIADSVARVVSANGIPVGLLTNLFGGPFFIYIFLKKQKGGSEVE